MAKRQTSQLLTAPAGTGKSYMVVHDLVHRLLPAGSKIITNLPLGEIPDTHRYPSEGEHDRFFWQRIASFCEQRHGCDAEAIADQIELIPDDVLESWRTTDSGPWEWLGDRDLTGCHIIIDEAHNFASSNSSKEKLKGWQGFCGELRHRGASIQFITQAPAKMSKEVIDECGMRQALIDAEEERDPFFNVKLYYWYELRAKITGTYRSSFVRVDIRDIDGKKTKWSNKKWVKRRQEIFRLYDSYAAPHGSGVAAHGDVAKREYERRSWPSFLLWLLVETIDDLGRPIAKIIGVVAFILFCRYGIAAFARGVGSAFEKPQSVQSVEVKKNFPSTKPLAPGVPSIEEIESKRVEPPQAQPTSVSPRNEEPTITAITPNTVTFSNSVTPVRLGKSILVGPLAGDVLQSIDPDTRSARLVVRGRMFLGTNTEERVEQSIPPELLDGELPASEVETIGPAVVDDRSGPVAPAIIRSSIGYRSRNLDGDTGAIRR